MNFRLYFIYCFYCLLLFNTGGYSFDIVKSPWTHREVFKTCDTTNEGNKHSNIKTMFHSLMSWKLNENYIKID